MSISIESSAQFAAPSWALMGLEPVRAAFEYAGMRTMDRSRLPTGDGHTVVLFPGLASDERAIGPLKEFCEGLGYAAQDWGRGFNTGPQGDPEEWLDELTRHIQTKIKSSRGTVSLVGWSLGGIYAREVAKRIPWRVRQVISIGTPFAGSSQHTRVGLVYRILNGSAPAVDDSLSRRLRTAPPVPTTSIYSRSDGVVAWQACIQRGRRGQTENIEVAGSHCGLGWNAKVFAALADRLSQAPGSWKPYAQAASATAPSPIAARFTETVVSGRQAPLVSGS